MYKVNAYIYAIHGYYYFITSKNLIDKSKNRNSSKIHTNFIIRCLTVIYWYVNIIYCIVVSNFMTNF